MDKLSKTGSFSGYIIAVVGLGYTKEIRELKKRI
jgi:hypothetical protein